MPHQQITMKDIAKALGVSVATVSRALADNPSISEKRRRTIQEYAKEHNLYLMFLRSHCVIPRQEHKKS